jgi:hypothetical protein
MFPVPLASLSRLCIIPSVKREKGKAMDITNTAYITTSEYEALVAIAAVEAELSGDYDRAEQIRKDYREGLLLAQI